MAANTALTISGTSGPGKLTDLMDVVNNVNCTLAQANAIINTILDSVVQAEQPFEPEALYGVRALLDIASEKLSLCPSSGARTESR
jgi:hypothetical protein